jgi:hypothetical protein
MIEKDIQFRQELFASQEMNPALREAFHGELDSMLHETLTPAKKIPGLALLIICLGVVIGEIRALLVYPGDARFYIAAISMAVVCAVAAAWIVRDLWRGKSTRKSAFKTADLFYGAAGVLVVVQFLHGMQAPAEPASTFGLLAMLTFLFVCGAWSLQNRIALAELSAREELLRIEYRLADMAERLHDRTTS